VRFQAAIFGGSAVARSTVRLLGDLPCRAEWYIEPGTDIPDSRPGNITIRVAVNLVDAVRSVTRGALLMIMTHDQSDDYALVAAALRRRDLSCVLLLGSLGKRERYVAQLAEEGLAAEAEARLICPIGITSGRRPAEIAIGAAARLLEASALPAALSAAHAA
jgi:xanthine dehydrogenase accessory factor